MRPLRLNLPITKNNANAYNIVVINHSLIKYVIGGKEMIIK